jgi:predicted transglutaminase-like cysteine proteinase
VRWIFRLSVAVTVVLSTGVSSAYTGVRTTVEHIRFDTPTLAPMAYTQFCLRYPEECRTRKIFRGGPVRLSASRRMELARVNNAVNTRIAPEANLQGLAGEVWLINPDRGDCNDYAVTKRHELSLLGWPARALLLSEVVTTGGEHHLVLVVRTSDGDLVLDSLTNSIKPWLKASYRWVRMQTPSVSKLWTTIVSRAA